jgi:thiamine phosphate synthase YjbQ (UPF0047 family)
MGITHGIVTISVIGSTASISTIEYEPALVKDLQNELEKWVPRTLQSLHSETWATITVFPTFAPRYGAGRHAAGG